MTAAEMVLEFHETFGHPIGAEPRAGIPDDRKRLRYALIEEELEEYGAALEDNDTVEVADALADLLYVVHGAAIEHGIDLELAVEEVHRSNMSKLGQDGKPIYREDGKTLKGPGYFPPDLATVLGIVV